MDQSHDLRELTEVQLDAVVEATYQAYANAMGGADELHRPFTRYQDLHTLYKGAWRQVVRTAIAEAHAQRHAVDHVAADRRQAEAAEAPHRTPVPEAPPGQPPSQYGQGPAQSTPAAPRATSRAGADDKAGKDDDPEAHRRPRRP